MWTRLATGYQDFLAVFENNSNFIIGQEVNDHTQSKGGMIDQVIDLEISGKGVWDFFL